MDQQIQKQLQLQAEIRLLEKQKQTVSFSLEQLESSHKEAYTQNTQIIKELTTRKEDLLSQIDKLRETLEIITSAYNQAKQSLEEFRSTRLKDVEIEVKNARASADIIKEQAHVNKIEAERLLIKAQSKETELATKEIALTIQAHEQTKLSESLEKRLFDDAIRHDRATHQYNLLVEQIALFAKNIDDLQKQKEQLLATIKEEKAKQEIVQEQLKIRLIDIEAKDRANLNRAQLLDKQEIDQIEENKAIKDKRQTLERAIAEFRAKGVKI